MAEAGLKSAGNRGKRDLEKERYWRHQVAEWRNSGLTARVFCQDHGISEGNLHTWQRELVKRDREGVPVATRKVKTAKPITGRGRTKPPGRRNADTRNRSTNRTLAQRAVNLPWWCGPTFLQAVGTGLDRAVNARL